MLRNIVCIGTKSTEGVLNEASKDYQDLRKSKDYYNEDILVTIIQSNCNKSMPKVFLYCFFHNSIVTLTFSNLVIWSVSQLVWRTRGVRQKYTLDRMPVHCRARCTHAFILIHT